MSAQPGFFGRLRDRFTQYAAGTDDLSQLSETQQKLLRREAIGRLGASLYRNGDFGEAMQQQGEINAKRAEQLQVERQRAEVNAILNPEQGALLQPGGVAAPQAPRLLQTASTNAAPGQPRQLPAQQPAAAGGGAQQPSPQQAAGLARDASAQRARYEQLAQYYASQGNHQMTKQAIDMANAFAAEEEYFTPIAAQVGGREVFIQGSKSGGMNVLDAAPMNTEAVRTAQQFTLPENADALATHLGIKMAGADRSSTVFNAPDAAAAEMVKIDSKRLDGMRTAMDTAIRTLPSLEAAFEAANRNDTGALSAALLPVQKFLNPDAPEVRDAPLLAAGVIDGVLGRLAQVGGSDTEREMLEIKNTFPNWANNPETNRRMFALAIRAMRELEQDVTSAENLYYEQGNLRGFRPMAFRGLANFQERVDASLGQGAAPRTSRFNGLE